MNRGVECNHPRPLPAPWAHACQGRIEEDEGQVAVLLGGLEMVEGAIGSTISHR